MSEYKQSVLQEASRILGDILKEELSAEDKDRVINIIQIVVSSLQPSRGKPWPCFLD